MENIYDIRKNENLLFVLSADEPYSTDFLLYNKVAVIINLYYLDTLDRYISYIDKILCEIDVYVYSSNSDVIEYVQRNVSRSNVVCILKENRGRDISTLLVAAADVVGKYDYICFTHDKKAHNYYFEKDIDYWITNLWENTLSSGVYVKRVLDLFKTSPDLGILAPPEPYGKMFSSWWGKTWGKNFELTKQLAIELGINVDISYDKKIFALGTAFWARVDALKLLYKKSWVYDDFLPEPLPVDGTVSHAIERILCYAAQAAGYKSGTIMTSEYAAGLFLTVRDDMQILFEQMIKRQPVYNLIDIQNLDEREKRIREFCNKYSQIYIYGAGDYGTKIYKFLKNIQCKCKGFVVSDGRRNKENVLGEKVWEIGELSLTENVGVIIGVSYEYKDEVEKTLISYGFSNYIYGY